MTASIGSLILVAGLVVLWVVEKSRRKTHPVTGGLHPEISLPHKAEFELYSNSFSHCSRKARLAMAELDIPVRHHAIDLVETGKYETISPAFLRINPAGYVPTLVHHGHPVYESDDILAYAAAHAPASAPSLTPGDAPERATMEQWIARATLPNKITPEELRHSAGACVPGLTLPIFMTAIRYIPLWRILPGFLFHPHKERPAFFMAARVLGLRRLCTNGKIRGMIRGSREHMRDHLQALEAKLVEGGPWILGEKYTLADVSWSALLLRLDETGWLDWFNTESPMPNVQRYYARVRERPSWRTAITEMLHPIIQNASADLKTAIASDASLRESLYQ